MRISILALDGVFDTGLTVMLDAFRLANKFAAAQGAAVAPFELSLVGVKKKVRSGQGFTIPVQQLGNDHRPDWVIVLALNAGSPEQLLEAFARRDVQRAQEHLLRWRAQGVQIAASCIGTFLLAEAGLLDGLEATTTWWLAPWFRLRYPQVRLDESRMLVPSPIGATAGAALGHLDLALWLIRKASPELSAVVSRYLLADIRSLQAPYIIPNHLAQADPLIRQFERWARERLQHGFSLEAAAGELAVSPRTLQRRCRDVLGKSPLAYFQDLRVERAQSLLHGSGLDLEAIAAQVGYEDGATLATLLRQKLGRGVRELRTDLR